MSRLNLGNLDRALRVLLGLVLIVLGVAAVGWQAGFLGSVWPDVPDQITVDSTQVTEGSSLLWAASSDFAAKEGSCSLSIKPKM